MFSSQPLKHKALGKAYTFLKNIFQKQKTLSLNTLHDSFKKNRTKNLFARIIEDLYYN